MEEATGPDREGTVGAEGAVGPSRLVLVFLVSDERDTFFDSWCLEGRCETPGGASGARFDASAASRSSWRMGSGRGGASSGGGILASNSLTAIQLSVPSSRAESAGDTNPSERYSRSCFSE